MNTVIVNTVLFLLHRKTYTRRMMKNVKYLILTKTKRKKNRNQYKLFVYEPRQAEFGFNFSNLHKETPRETGFCCLHQT